jgi:hypothetical protein
MERLESKALLELQECRVLLEMLVEQEPLVFPALLVCKEPQETSELLELQVFPAQQEFRVQLEKALLVQQVSEQLVFKALRAILEPQGLLDCRVLQEHKGPLEMSAHKELRDYRVPPDCKGLQVIWAELELLVLLEQLGLLE